MRSWQSSAEPAAFRCCAPPEQDFKREAVQPSTKQTTTHLMAVSKAVTEHGFL